VRGGPGLGFRPRSTQPSHGEPALAGRQGQAAIAGFLRDRASPPTRHYRLIPTRANSQPAFGCYATDAQAPIARAHGVMVLTLEGNRISMLTRFLDNGVLPHFGLPRTLRG